MCDIFHVFYEISYTLKKLKCPTFQFWGKLAKIKKMRGN